MNRALRYFGGKKNYLIPFLVLMGIYILSYLRNIYQWCRLFQFSQYFAPIYIVSIILFETLLVLSVISLWLSFKRKSYIIILSLLSLSLVIKIIFGLLSYGFNYSTIIGLLNSVSCITVIILLRLRAKKKIIIAPFMIISFVMMSGLTSFDITHNIIYYDIAGTIIYNIIPNLCLTAALVMLWIPLEKSLICPKCGRRNSKAAGFCGGCGSPLK